jgi:hypothetical protein
MSGFQLQVYGRVGWTSMVLCVSSTSKAERAGFREENNQTSLKTFSLGTRVNR